VKKQRERKRRKEGRCEILKTDNTVEEIHTERDRKDTQIERVKGRGRRHMNLPARVYMEEYKEDQEGNRRLEERCLTNVLTQP
jgi:hypothetical protein